MTYDQEQDVLRADITLADHSSIQALLAVCAQYDGFSMPINVENLADEPGNGFLYYRDNLLIGVAFLFSELSLEVVGIVHPAYRRQGVGRRLLEAVKIYCREQAKAGLTIIGFDGIAVGKAFILAAGGEYTISEYHMELAITHIKRPTTWRDDLMLRQAAPDEAQQVSSILMQAFDDPEDEVIPWVAKAILKPARRFFVVLLGHEVVGSISVVAEEAEQIDITAFGILPQYQRRGLGRQVLTQTVEMLIAEGWRQIGLDVETENSSALGLYQSCGFQQTQVNDYYRIQL